MQWLLGLQGVQGVQGSIGSRTRGTGGVHEIVIVWPGGRWWAGAGVRPAFEPTVVGNDGDSGRVGLRLLRLRVRILDFDLGSGLESGLR